MAHGGDMQGVMVTKEEAAAGIGFSSPAEMDRFYELMAIIEPLVGEKISRIYGKDPKSQWVFEIAAGCVEAFMRIERGTAGN